MLRNLSITTYALDEFEEDAHPRDEHGRFSNTGMSTVVKVTKAAVPAVHENYIDAHEAAIAHHKMESAPLPEEVEL